MLHFHRGTIMPGEAADDVDRSDPDELEDEIEQAEEEGEFKSVHASRTTVTIKKTTKTKR